MNSITFWAPTRLMKKVLLATIVSLTIKITMYVDLQLILIKH